MTSNNLLDAWEDNASADDAWIYDWATTINEVQRVEDPIEVLLRESLALEPSMFEPEYALITTADKSPPGMGAVLETSRALATIVEETDPVASSVSSSDRDTLTCNCCTEVAALRSDMTSVLHELQEIRGVMRHNQPLESRIKEVEELSIEFMEVARGSIAMLQSDRAKAEVWMYQYQAWADTTHIAMQHLLREPEEAGVTGTDMMAEESVE